MRIYSSEKFSIECQIYKNLKKRKSDIEKYEKRYKKTSSDVGNIETQIVVLQTELSEKITELVKQKLVADLKKYFSKTFKKKINTLASF